MFYQVSPAIAECLEALLAMPQVQNALAQIQADNAVSVEEQIEFCLIEAPTFHEESRAIRLKEKLDALGIQNVVIDEQYNVEGILPGTQGGEVLIEAHLDTVFPRGTTSEVRQEGEMLYAPGIYDNARGIACMLATLRALRSCGLQTRRNLIVGGTTREEATGGLNGMREFIAKHPHPHASISVDGGFMEAITFNATYHRSVEYTFHGIGGHAFGAFGLVANPLGAACRAVTNIEKITVPAKPRTTYAATILSTPDYNAITSIPDKCTLSLNYRSDGKEEFEQMERQIEKAVHAACQEETARWGKDTITVERTILSWLPGGRQEAHAPIVEAYYACAQFVGAQPELRYSGNSNSNTISMGIPAVTVGSSRSDYGAHTLGERFCITDAYRCPQGLFLLLLLLLGVEDGIEPCL